MLSSSRGQANFRGLEASRPRPRTSKCVLEAKDVLEDSTSGKDVHFTTTMLACLGFNSHPGHVVAPLDKTLCDDYVCLVASNKQQIQMLTGRLGKWSTSQLIRIRPKNIASVAFSWKEDKDAATNYSQVECERFIYIHLAFIFSYLLF